MADSAIFKYANDITMNRSASSARSVTTGGYGRTHRLGPSLLSIDANLPLLSEEQYLEVENELLSIEDGIQFLEVNPSSNNGNNIISNKAIPLKTGETEIKVMQTSYSTLRELTLTNFAPNTNKIFKVGDMIQLHNSPKVYQIFKPIGQTGAYFNSTGTGTVTVRLSSPLVSNLGINLSSNASGATVKAQIVNGTSTDQEIVEYDYNYNTAASNTLQDGLITFKNLDGSTYQYADGTYARIWMYRGYSSNINLRNILNSCIAGSHTIGTDSEDAQNNKLGEILDSVEASGISSGDVIRFFFKLPNIRVEYTVPLYTNQTYSFDNINVTQALTNPSVDGKIKFKNVDNTYVKFADGTDAEIIIPKENQTVVDIYNYLNSNSVTGNSSTHRIKTENILNDVTAISAPEIWGETNLNHSGFIYFQYGPEHSPTVIEFTPTGSIPTAYNEYTVTGDKLFSINGSEFIIQDAQATYAVGEYIQTLNNAISQTNTTKRIDGVSVSGDLTTLTLCENAEGAHIAVNNFAVADVLRTAGTYTGVGGTSSGSGTVGTFDIVVDANGDVTSVTIVTTGSGHTVGDTITIADSNLGNGGAVDFTMDIQTIDINTGAAFNTNSGWNANSSSDIYDVVKHKNSANQTSTGFIKPLGTVIQPSFPTSSYPVKMGTDINIKLMLTKKPAVTIIPKDEEENLYVYDKFEFQEVL